MTSGRDRNRDAVGGAAAGRDGGGSRAAATADVGTGGGERPHEDVMAVVEQVSRGEVGERGVVRCTRYSVLSCMDQALASPFVCLVDTVRQIKVAKK